MKRYFIILSISVIAVMLFSGCWKKPTGSFTLKGRLLYQSDSTPVPGHQVTVTYHLWKGGLEYKRKW